MGGRKGALPQKRKRHEASASLGPLAAEACEALICLQGTPGGDAAARQALARDVAALNAADRPEVQSRLVAAWRENVFSNPELSAAASRALASRSSSSPAHTPTQADLFWLSFCRLLTSLFFCHAAQHLQKVLKGAASLPSAPDSVLRCLREITFGETCAAWAALHPSTPHAAVVGDIDCLLDTRPLFTESVAANFPRIFLAALQCCESSLAAIGVEGGDAQPQPQMDSADASVGGDSAVDSLKYFLRITQDFLQKRDHRPQVAAQLSAWHGPPDHPAPSDNTNLIPRLLGVAQPILLNSSRFPKELVAPAGYALSLVLVASAGAMWGDEPHRQAAFLRGCAAGCLRPGSTPSPPPTPPPPHTPHSLSDAVLGSLRTGSPSGVAEFCRGLSGMPSLALLSGLVNSASDSVYLAEVGVGVGLEVEGGAPPAPSCLLFSEVLSCIEAYAAAEDPRVKFFALQGAKLVVQKVGSALSSRAKQAGGGAAAATTPLLQEGGSVASALSRVLEIQWALWDEPTAQIGHLLTAIFKATVETYQAAGGCGGGGGGGASSLDIRDLCRKLLDAPWQRRGKYPSLSVILPSVGVEEVRRGCPQLVPRVLDILHVKNLAHGAGEFLAAFSQALLRLPTPPAEGTATPHLPSPPPPNTPPTPFGRSLFISVVLEPMADALLLREPIGVQEVTAHSLLLNHCCTYALQPLFASRGRGKGHADTGLEMYRVITEHLFHSAEKALEKEGVSRTGVLKRLVACHVTLCRLAKQGSASSGVGSAISAGLLHRAIEAESDLVRMAAVKILCIGFSPSTLPARQELALLKGFTLRNFKTADASFRVQHFDIMKLMLSRIKDSLHRFEKDKSKSRDAATHTPPEEQDSRDATEEYIMWLCRYLVQSSYATSPLDRRCMALEMLQHIIRVFSEGLEGKHPEAVRVYSAAVEAALPKALLPVLLATLSESWDRVRQATWDLIKLFPAPLPGYAAPQEVRALAADCSAGIWSHKIKDADSAALLFRLLHRKYGIQLGYQLSIHPEEGTVLLEDPPQGGAREGEAWAAHLRVLRSLVSRIGAMQAQRDRLGGFAAMHGTLGAMRNVLIDADLKGLAALPDASVGEWVATLQDAARAVVAMCTDAMRNVAGATTGDIEALREGDAPGTASIEQPAGVDCRGHAFFADRTDNKGDRLVVVNSWLAVKEGCVLLTEVLLQAPLGRFVPAELVDECGLFFLRMGLQGKHNGVIAKAAEALGQVCHRVLRLPGAPHIPLSRLPAAWLRGSLVGEQVLSRNANRILRRSAGLPPMLLSVLDAEDHTQGTPELAHETVAVLMRIATGAEVVEAEEGGVAAAAALQTAHRINALNVLKYVVDDSNLREVVAQYGGRLLLISVEGFNHDSWNVRNSSLMLFSSLLHRVVGAGHGTTSLKDFLQRNACAVPALLRLLGDAVAGAGDSSGRIRQLHPALHPLLVLFSLLSPSSDLHSAAVQAAYFRRDVTGAPFSDEGRSDARVLQDVESCYALKHSLARSMSARALVPLVATHALGDAVQYFIRRAAHLLRPGQPLNNNALHGRMMQVLEVLRHARTLEPGDRAKANAAAVEALASTQFIAVLQARLGGGDAGGRIAPPNTAAALELFTLLLSAEGAGAGLTGTLAAECSAFSQRALQGDLHRMAVRDIAGDEVAARAAVLHLRSCALQGDTAAAARFLQAAVLGSCTASRATAGAKHSRFFVDALQEAQAHLTALLADTPAWRSVVAAVLAELRSMADTLRTHPALLSDIQHAENFSALLGFFSAITDIDAAAVPPGIRGELAAALGAVRAACPNQGVVRALLRQQASLAHQAVVAALQDPSSGTALGPLLEDLCSVLYKHTHGDETPDVRRGSVEALVALRVDEVHRRLQGSPNVGTEVRHAVMMFLVGMQRVRIALLSDEDADIRSAAAATVAPPPQPQQQQQQQGGGDTATDSILLAHAAAAPGLCHSERSVEHCFAWFTRLAADAAAAGVPSAVTAVLEHLTSIVLHPVAAWCFSLTYEGVAVGRGADTPPGLPYDRAGAAAQENVVFELENHNYHMEELVAVQLALRECREVLRLALGAGGGAASAAHAFAPRLASRVAVEAAAVRRVCDADPAVRALAFTSVYRVNAAALLLAPSHPADAAPLLRALPPTPLESLWLSPLSAAVDAGISPESLPALWAQLLFLIE